MKLFNFYCNSNLISEKILGGCNVGLIDPNSTKYPVFYDIFNLMIQCNWVPEEVDLTNDKNDYLKLTSHEKRAYSKVLSQLIFMDSIQTENTSGNVIPFITEPVIINALVRQAYEEGNHSISYYRMADSIYENPEEIYNMWKNDEILKEKNIYIGSIYEKYSIRAIETDDKINMRLSFFYNLLKDDSTNKKEKIKKLVSYIFNSNKIITQNNNRVFTINPETRKKEILNKLKHPILKEIIEKFDFKELSDLDIDYFKNSLFFIEEELEILENINSFEEYVNLELYKRFEAQVLMIIANQALEGIYFYSGFVFIYLLGRQGKMLGSTDMIRFIHRDEINHTLLFSSIFRFIYKENKEKFNIELFEKCVKILRDAALLEIKWGQYIIQDNIDDINNKQIENYIKFLANDRFKKLGLNKIENLTKPFPEIENKNPLKWVDKFSKLDNTKTNFFEGTNKNYDNKGLNLDKIVIEDILLEKIMKI